jgi:VWFA-related protein
VVIAALVTLVSAPLAAASVRIANVDASGHPSVRLTVVTSEPTTSAPRLTEDGQPVAGLTAANLGHAKKVVLAVDRSPSMRGRALRDTTQAAIRFTALKPSDDQIEVVMFSSDTLFQTQFTSDPSEAESALRGISDDPKYGTTLYDAIVRSAKSLANAGAPGRMIVLVTDGQETTSHATLEKTIRAARKAHALVYPIAIESKAFSPGPLKQLARRTGGSYYGARSSSDLASIYQHISQELRRTRRLEYFTAAQPGDRASTPHLERPTRHSGRGHSPSRFTNLCIPGDTDLPDRLHGPPRRGPLRTPCTAAHGTQSLAHAPRERGRPLLGPLAFEFSRARGSR